MDRNLHIDLDLTELIKKFPEAAVSSLLEQTESYKMAEDETGIPRCPYCGNTHTVKNGHKCGKQEYRCKDCRRTFVSTTNTIMSGSHQSRECWEEVISDALKGTTAECTARRLGLSFDCVFRMRYKILFSLREKVFKDVAESRKTCAREFGGEKERRDAPDRGAGGHGAGEQIQDISSKYICMRSDIENKDFSSVALITPFSD